MNTKSVQAAKLREELKSLGSNLLVVYNFCEVIIPSLARVLNVNTVLTHPLSSAYQTDQSKMFQFKEEKLKEVSHLLNMHSINLKISKLNQSSDWMPLPVFPSINPGAIKY